MRRTLVRTSAPIFNSLRRMVPLITEIRAAQAELGQRIDRRGLDGMRETAAPVDLARFMTGLRVAWREGEQRPTHRRPYRRRKPVPRRSSMLDDLQDQIRSWLSEKPGLTATEILGRLKAMHPERFTDKQARTVQRAVKQWRASEARRIIIEGAAAISAGLPSASEMADAAVRPAA